MSKALFSACDLVMAKILQTNPWRRVCHHVSDGSVSRAARNVRDACGVEHVEHVTDFLEFFQSLAEETRPSHDGNSKPFLHQETNVDVFVSFSLFFVQKAMSKRLQLTQVEYAWKEVKDDFDLKQLFTEKGAAFVQEQAVKKCLHPLSISMTTLASLAPLSNGAQVKIWAEPTPLVLAAVLINPPQSRKSQTTSLARQIGVVLDEVFHARERELPDAEQQGEPLPSSVLEGFTPEAESAPLVSHCSHIGDAFK